MTATAKPSAPAADVAPEAAAPVEGRVNLRVLKKGDGKISKGVHVAAQGDEKFAMGDVFECSREAADAYEDAGMGEIQK